MSKDLTNQQKVLKLYSTLAGALQPVKNWTGKVQFAGINLEDRWVYRSWAKVLAYGTLLIVLAFEALLFRPSHWIALLEPQSPRLIANWVMLICLFLLQLFLITGTFAATRATLKAKNPVPFRPAKGLRVAFVTTRAPGEPIDMVRKTLAAIKQVRYKQGVVDAWLLDETNSSELKAICEGLGVNYFTRFGVTKWNQPKEASKGKNVGTYIKQFIPFMVKNKVDDSTKPNPLFAAKTKHGNFNSWIEYTKSKGYTYDLLAGVDTDHVPQQNYLERTLGYFRDQDVAFVVGPQVYGNYKRGLNGLVSRWAESQASFFQSTIQRAGNASASPMFVGTNYVIRFSALEQINGFQACVTEDMLTGLRVHANKNTESGNRWKSVYTPDVLACGEGPTMWGTYFSQQWRWAAGSFDTWKLNARQIFFGLPKKSRLHYLLMLTFYPMTALTWLLGVVSSMIYLITGATAVVAPWNQFVSLYLMSLVMQLSLYFWNRRYNVSPHEPMGTYGVAGMAITTITAPIYLSAFIDTLRGKKPNFVVTTKGEDSKLDSLQTFHLHIKWGALLLAGLVYGVLHNHYHPAMLIWIGMQLLVCITPVTLGVAAIVKHRLRIRSIEKNVLNVGEQNAF